MYKKFLAPLVFGVNVLTFVIPLKYLMRSEVLFFCNVMLFCLVGDYQCFRGTYNLILTLKVEVTGFSKTSATA
jgi:hypothetical protein